MPLSKLRLAGLFVSLMIFLLAGVGTAKNLPVMRGVGDNFTADSSLGHPVSLSDYKGKVVLLTFGFTNCPDVCPITLGYLNHVYEKLTAEQQKNVDVFFITVDPEQDTPEHLKNYLKEFNEDFTGISPGKDNLAVIAKQFGVKYEEVQGIRVPTRYNRSLVKLDKDNTAKAFNHSISIFLLDQQNRTRGIYYSGSDSDQLAANIGALIAERKTAKGKDSRNITTGNFWIRLTPKASKVTAMYGKITNNSDRTIHLTSAACKSIAKKSMLHLTKIVDSQAKMVHQKRLAIAPRSSLIMKPMSYHTMLMGLKKPLVEGETANCLLTFDNNETKTIQATIKTNKSNP